jgi:acyl carrier protein
VSSSGERAPEANLSAIKPDVNFREQIDLDSMDYLNFVIAPDKEFQANIPETEYTKFLVPAPADRVAKFLLRKKSCGNEI